MAKKAVELKAGLISRLIVLVFVVIAFYSVFDEHYPKIASSIISLLIISALVLALVVSIGATIHAIWKYMSSNKNI